MDGINPGHTNRKDNKRDSEFDQVEVEEGAVKNKVNLIGRTDKESDSAQKISDRSIRSGDLLTSMSSSLRQGFETAKLSEDFEILKANLESIMDNILMPEESFHTAQYLSGQGKKESKQVEGLATELINIFLRALKTALPIYWNRSKSMII